MSSNLPIVFLFSGQGSQYRGMGQALFEQEPVFRDSMEKADSIVQRQLSRSLIHELYTEKQPVFDDLLVTHPAIVAIEIALLRVLEAMGIRADHVSGNSLGEFAAAVAAGIWTEQSAIEAAIEQAKSITRNDVGGGMLAVLHQNSDAMKQLYNSHGLFLAADNFDGHFTLSGAARDLDRFQSDLDLRGIQFQRLEVAYPFHSPLIEGAAAEFSYHTSGMPDFASPQSGFVSGMSGEELAFLPRDYFWQVAGRYTNFQKLVRYLEAKGPCLYIDLGPSGTSANFVRYNLDPSSASQTFSIITRFKKEKQQLEALAKLLGLK